jgi:hypothetical protein
MKNADQYIIENYPDMTARELSDATGKPVWYVYGLAQKLGLKKSEAFLNSNKSGRMNKGSDRGKNTQFKEGLKPWNKGTKGLCSPNKHSFATGHVPHNALPDWAESVRIDSKSGRKYLLLKLPGVRKLVFKHVWLWLQHHNEVPDGHVVVFKDGNTMNCVIDNLECITRKTLMVRNSIMRYPKELRDTIKLVHKINKKINSYEKQD